MTLQPGTRLAQYEVVGFIGAGGMGEVYRARDSRLGRDVALKVLPADLSSDPDMRARFEREARAVAALSHQNIMAIHELAVIDDRPVAVVELLEGESLRTRLERGPLSWRDAAQIAARVADGLAAAHAKGIVHRDVKPENLFITSDQRPKLLDFGLAHAEPEPAALASTEVTIARTEPGRVLGTVGYMAPEQLRGEPVGPPADIFALGCTLVEMLTGRKPFLRSTVAESIGALLHEPAPDLDQSGLDLPPRLGDIVRHCLEKDPAKRFGCARDLAAALRSVLSDAGPSPGPARRTRRTRGVAVLPFTCLETDERTEYMADGLTESIINSLSQLPRLRVVPRSTVFSYKGRTVTARSAGLALNADTLVTGRVVHVGAELNVQVELVDVTRETQIWGDRYRYPVSDLLTLQEQIAWQISEALRVQLTEPERRRLRRRLTARPTENTDAYEAYLRGRHAWARWTAPGFREAIVHFETAIRHDARYARAHSGLSDSYAAAGYYGYMPAELAMPRAAAAAYKALELDPTLAEAHATMALIRMFFYWDWIGAEQALRTSTDLDPRYPVAHMLLGLLHTMLGRHTEAIDSARRGRDLDPLSPVMQMGVTWTMYFAKQYREALESLREVTTINPDYPEAHAMLVLLYEGLGLFDRAADAFGDARRLFAPSGVEDPVSRLKSALETSGPPGYWQVRLELLRGVGSADVEAGGVAPQAYTEAALLTQLGNTDEAFAALDRSFAQRFGHMVFMRVDPRLDPLRGDPRLETYLRRMGYPVDAAAL